MKLLVDSHMLIWMLYEPERFSPPVRDKIENAEVVYVSVASLWELMELYREGKLAYGPDELVRGVDVLGLKVLPINADHTVAAGKIEDKIKDFWDRMLAAQAQTEGCRLLTANTVLAGAGVATLGVK